MVSIGAVGGGITEGEYTTWTAKWGWALPNGLENWPPGPGFYIEEANNIFYLWWYADSPSKQRFGTYKISDHSTIFQSPSDSDYTYESPIIGGYGDCGFSLGCHSTVYEILRSHQTYILLNRYNLPDIEVWKAGAKLWSRDIKGDTGESFGEIQTAEISLTGKYIMLYEIYSAKLWLYEGS